MTGSKGSNTAMGSTRYDEIGEDFESTFGFKEIQRQKQRPSMVYFFDIKHKSKKPLIQIATETSPMKVPFGISQYDETQVTYRKNMDMNVGDDDQERWFQAFDEWIIQKAFEHSEEWFPKLKGTDEFKKATIRSNYTPCIKHNEKYPSKIRTKAREDEICVHIKKMHSDEENEINVNNKEECSNKEIIVAKGSFEDIEPGVIGIPIAEFKGLWFGPRSWGCTIVTMFFLKFNENKSKFPYQLSKPAKIMSKEDECKLSIDKEKTMKIEGQFPKLEKNNEIKIDDVNFHKDSLLAEG
jgi:hypothetical protein